MMKEYVDVLPENSDYDALLDYYQAVEVLDANDVTQAEKREALQSLERLWNNGFAVAAAGLGRMGWVFFRMMKKPSFGFVNLSRLELIAPNMPWERSSRNRDEWTRRWSATSKLLMQETKPPSII